MTIVIYHVKATQGKKDEGEAPSRQPKALFVITREARGEGAVEKTPAPGNFLRRHPSKGCCRSREAAIMRQLRYLATAAALAIGVAQSPVAASANEGGGHGGHFGGGHASAGGRIGVGRAFAGGHFDPRFDRQFGRFRGRAIFGVGGVFLGYDFGFGLGYGYPGYYPAWYCSQYPYGYYPAVGCYYPYPGPTYYSTVGK
jgi:hypothetical protein